jgi:hypothetical protein
VFPTAVALTQRMNLRCTFKGVTYETLKDPNFIEYCKGLYPELEQKLVEEFDPLTSRSTVSSNSPTGRSPAPVPLAV